MTHKVGGAPFFARCNTQYIDLIIKHGLTPWVHRHNTLLFVNLRFQFINIKYIREAVLIGYSLIFVGLRSVRPSQPKFPAWAAHSLFRASPHGPRWAWSVMLEKKDIYLRQELNSRSLKPYHTHLPTKQY